MFCPGDSNCDEIDSDKAGVISLTITAEGCREEQRQRKVRGRKSLDMRGHNMISMIRKIVLSAGGDSTVVTK